MSLIKEVWEYLKARKAWWLAPALITLVLVGALILAAQSGAISPLIYVLF